VEVGVKALRISLATLLALAAFALLALAWQVHSWKSTMRDDDLTFQVTPTAKGLWSAPSGPGSDVAKRLLAVGDDLEFRNAEQLFVQVHLGARDYAQETQRLAAFGRAQSSLEALARSDSSPARRARAANLLGILLWENAAAAQDNSQLLLQQSVEAFKTAVRSSATEEDAKYNLEVLSTLLQSPGDRRVDAPEGAGGEGLRGAGIAGPGRGY
jgi:hypothetical protein